MPLTTTTAGTYDALLSSTLAKYVQKNLENTIFDDLVFFYVLTGRHQKGMAEKNRGVTSGKKPLAGGESIVIPLLYEANNTSGSYNGYDLLPTTPQDGITICQYAWKQTSVSISLSGREERINSDAETKMLDLLRSKIQQAEMSLSDTMSQQLFSDGTGNSSKDITGLQAIVANTPTTGTLAGINRATYTWWQNQYQNSMGSFAAAGIRNMRTMFNLCSRGQTHPELLLTTRTIHEYYEDALEPQLRYSNTNLADAGFTNLDFNGMPVVYDLDCPSGVMYFLNFKFLQLVVHKDADFTSTPFQKPENQDAKVAQILWQGNLTCSNCRYQGIITGITQ